MKDGGAVLVTALHVMDELIRKKGLDFRDANRAYTGRELPSVVTQVKLYDVFAKTWILSELGTAGPMWILPNARINDEEPYSGQDIAVFLVSNPQKLSPMQLASQAPDVGEPVWVAARASAADARAIALPAVVVELTDRSFVFRYARGAPEVAFTSGAPVLNRGGEVVAINVGGGYLDGRRLGHGNQATSIWRHIQESPGASA
jgi:hypothetical protein